MAMSDPDLRDPQAEPTSNSRTQLRLLAGAGVLAVLVIVALLARNEAGQPPSTSADGGPATVTVTYELSGSATDADITVSTPTGMSQQQDVAVPLTSKAGATGISYDFRPGNFVSMSAQNKGDGDITCTIREGGTVISQNTSSGQYAIAECSGSA